MLTWISISTEQYLCYFNQSPETYDPTAATQTCAGPKSSVQGGITASMAGGSWVGALVSGPLSDRLGRKRAIQVGTIFWYVWVFLLRLNNL